MVQFPVLSALPPVEGQPQGCMWGFWDKPDSPPDELGSLNLLTDANTVAAMKLVTTGARFQLDWPLHNVEFPAFGRAPLRHSVRDRHKMVGVYASDDEVAFNTQCGSQWDGFKHIANQKSGKYYNNLSHADNMASSRNGIHAWCRAGGLIGRGVLLDFVRWHEHTHPDAPPPPPVGPGSFSAADLDAVAAFQNTTFQQGDILIVRCGFVRWHNAASADERRHGTAEQTAFLGLEASPASVEWLYDHHFAAVAGDMYAFEAWPPADKDTMLHDWLLAQWGTPIGEMWDLEALAAHCAKEGRWDFCLTSAPMHVEGGVGSTPNTLAIF